MVKTSTGGSQKPGGVAKFPIKPLFPPDKPEPPVEGSAPRAEVEDIATRLDRMLSARMEELVAITTFRVPEEYDRHAVQRTIEDGLNQVERQLREEIRALAVEPTGAEPGLTIPPRSQAVTLNFAQSSDIDRWDERQLPTSSGKTYRGPGRVWRVTNADFPRSFDRGASVRYRLNLDQVRFGVMGVRFLDTLGNFSMASVSQTGSQLEVTYGIVVTGIPWFSERPPSTVLFVDSAGHPISSMQGRESGAGQNFMHLGESLFAEGKTKGEFVSNSPNPYESMRDADLQSVTGGVNHYSAGSEYVKDVQGVGVMLITGDTSNRVYGQLHGLESGSTPHVAGFGRGPTASFPEGLEVLPPAAAQYVTIHQNGGPGTNYNRIKTRQYETGLGDNEEVCVGGPAFRWDDCGALAVRPDSFSVAVTILPRKILAWDEFNGLWTLSGEADAHNFLSYDMQPASMWTSGLRYRREGSKSRRDSQIEMVVI